MIYPLQTRGKLLKLLVAGVDLLPSNWTSYKVIDFMN